MRPSTRPLSRSNPRADERARFLEEVLHCLRQLEKELPCKYFYDEHGAALFEAICDLEEYYLTRTEQALMHQHASEMAACLGPDCLLIEYGSGSSRKTRFLLDHMERPTGYIPIDLSREHLFQTARQLTASYPGLEVLPLCADFSGNFELPRPRREERRRVVYFPGSTIGNFGPPEAATLLRRVASLVGPGGGLLLGFDLQKDLAMLEPAYNDARGVTAEFNLNLLARINRELGVDFDLQAFNHRAFYNTQLHCIEMHLFSTRAQAVHLAGEVITFAEGESVRTERSYKYDVEAFRSWVVQTGLEVDRVWMDDRGWFAVLYLRTSDEDRA
jgi:dimethylhistidine N-methyltransferase